VKFRKIAGNGFIDYERVVTFYTTQACATTPTIIFRLTVIGAFIVEVVMRVVYDT
jgi:hypothetical protein